MASRIFFMVVLALPAHGEGWRGYWGAGWYTGLQDGNFLVVDQVGADVGIYRDVGKGTVIGIAAGLGVETEWIYLMDLRINAMRYLGGRLGQGAYFKSEVGTVHGSAPDGRYFKGQPRGLGSIGGAGAGYEWRWRESLSLRLQGQGSLRYAIDPANVFYQLFFYLGKWR